jgi:hypothetical protein
MQQTLVCCAFCDAAPGTGAGKAHTWGQDDRVSHPICVDYAIQTEPDPDERDHVACDDCGLVVDTLAALIHAVGRRETDADIDTDSTVTGSLAS